MSLAPKDLTKNHNRSPDKSGVTFRPPVNEDIAKVRGSSLLRAHGTEAEPELIISDQIKNLSSAEPPSQLCSMPNMGSVASSPLRSHAYLSETLVAQNKIETALTQK